MLDDKETLSTGRQAQVDQALQDSPDNVESTSPMSPLKKKPKPPTLSKNGVRMGRPPGTKNKPKPNGPKVGRPSLSTIFMRQQISVSVPTSPFGASDSADGEKIVCSSADSELSRDHSSKDPSSLNVAITDDMRDRLGLLPFDPDLKFKHGYLAKRQKCRFAVIPMYSKEERLLFAEIIRDRPVMSLDWGEIAKLWNSYADGKFIFYKLPEHVDSYFRLLRECARTFAAKNPQNADVVGSLSSSFGKRLASGDLGSMILALAVTAAYIPGSGVTMESLVTARSATSIRELEDMVASLDAELQRYLDAQDGPIDLFPAAKKRGRKPGTKNSKPKKVEVHAGEGDVQAKVKEEEPNLLSVEVSDEGDMDIDDHVSDKHINQNSEQPQATPSDVFLTQAMSGSFEAVNSYYSTISSSSSSSSDVRDNRASATPSSTLSSVNNSSMNNLSSTSRSFSPFSNTLVTMAAEDYAVHDSRSLFTVFNTVTNISGADDMSNMNSRGQAQQNYPIYYY
ncbi:hypothetical protein V1525DRAFT_402111 [Lipomyces kononenkoae]|uniref:Uncharacterized protein n=1 Tax=Lipomyces kononenkoae TaxID=34357 RepID=A0ACC3T2N6_LIPKO